MQEKRLSLNNFQKGISSNLFAYLTVFATIILISASMVFAQANALAVTAGPPAIDLGTAANFVILSNTGITDVPLSSITGNIGTSLDSANSDISFAGMTCAEVTGGIYSIKALTPMACEISDVITGTTIVSTAVADMGAAYTAASDPATPAGVGATNLNVDGGTLSGNIFTPGVYTWNTPVTITGDITISGTATDIFVFQVSGTLGIDANKKIILIGALPQNIFWQVAGTTTLNAGSSFVGTILDQTLIEMKTGATLNGRALAQTAVTLDQNTVSLSAPPVVDTTNPIITMNGLNPIDVTENTIYIDAGATALDDTDGNITLNIITNNNVDTTLIGAYSVVYAVSDASGNTATETRVVNVVDTTIPVITLVGINPQIITIGNLYTELGATALDNYDGVITANIIIDASAVDTNTLGSYIVTYNVADSSLNNAIQVTRTIDVVAAPDVIAPVITMNGISPVDVTQNTIYTDAGATATDNVDLIVTVNSVSTVDTATIGVYTVTYSATDSSGNAAIAVVRTVNVIAVVDITIPVITILGSTPMNVDQNAVYTDAGATALDNVDGVITANIVAVNLVDTATVGAYTVTYDVADAALNDAIQVTRTVNVIVPVVAQLTVNLGTAGDYIILAKTAVSTTGTTSIIGNVGVSPVAATYLTGFGLIMDSTNVFSTSSLVTGKLYAADYAVPTPINMGTAISDMEIAYTDAAGRTLPDATELGAGDISGMTLAPGLYKWSTDVMMDNTGVTLSGDANAIWIFQISGNLNVANAAHVNLIGGAQAKNVFWQVGGVTGATLGTTSIFNGNILSAKQIILNTGAIMHGRALSQTQVTLDSNTVSLPIAPSGSAIVTTITIVPITSNITIGSTLQVNATSLDQFDLPIVANISYISSDSSIATVNATSGLVTAVASGSVIITALDGTVNRSVIIMITPLAVVTPVTNPVSGGSGGSGGGTSCNTEWSCTAWSSCVNGIKTRTCSYTQGYCAPETTKPIETISCTSNTDTDIVTEEGNTSTETSDTGPTGLFLGLSPINTAGIAVVVIVGAGLAYFYRKKIFPKKK